MQSDSVSNSGPPHWSIRLALAGSLAVLGPYLASTTGSNPLDSEFVLVTLSWWAIGLALDLGLCVARGWKSSGQPFALIVPLAVLASSVATVMAGGPSHWFIVVLALGASTLCLVAWRAMWVLPNSAPTADS